MLNKLHELKLFVQEREFDAFMQISCFVQTYSKVDELAKLFRKHSGEFKKWMEKCE